MKPNIRWKNKTKAIHILSKLTRVDTHREQTELDF